MPITSKVPTALPIELEIPERKLSQINLKGREE